ncbi:MAG: hypothetical protein WDO24_07500 [Pseudomonadota bacterium]
MPPRSASSAGTASADTAFRREGELLRLEFGQRGTQLTVRFALSPVH